MGLDNYNLSLKEGFLMPFHSVYAERHWEQANSSKNKFGKLGHRAIAVLESIPIVCAMVSLMDFVVGNTMGKLLKGRVTVKTACDLKTTKGIHDVTKDLIQHLKDNGGLTQEGIFRTVGSTKLINETYNNMEKKSYYSLENHTLNDISGLLKRVFRKNVEDLSFFDKQFLESLDDVTEPNPKNEIFKEHIDRLDNEKQELLKYLIRFLGEVEQKKDVNLMTAANLAACWAPNLVWLEEMDLNILLKLTKSKANPAIAHLIENRDKIFPDLVPDVF